MATLAPSPKFRVEGSDGLPLVGGKVYTYVAGTTTPKTTTVSNGGANNTNPVILDARGECDLWLDGSYKITVTTSADVPVWTVDGISDSASLLSASTGSALVGFVNSPSGSVARTVQARLRDTISAFDFMTAAQIADIQARTLTLDVTVPLQAFFDACRGKRGYLPAGSYKKTAQITLDPVYSYCIEGDGWNSENGADQGTAIVDTTDANGLFIYYNQANYAGGAAGGGYPNSDNRVRLARFKLVGPQSSAAASTHTIGIEGVNTVTPKGNGIYAYWTQGLELEDVWIDGYQSDGIYGYRCFSIVLNNVWTIKNNKCGIHLFKTANAVHLTGLKSLSNCRIASSSINYNLLIDGAAGFENLNPVIDGSSDLSYPGASGPHYYSVALSTLTSVVVSGGTATVNAPAHGFTVGDKVAIWGAVSSPTINTVNAPATVLTAGTNSFTVATTAANATYNEATLQVSPWAGGIGLDNIQGAQIEAYVEDPSGPGLYVGPSVKSFAVRGGYWQDARIIIDTAATGGTIANCAMMGIRSGLYMPNEMSAVLWGNSYINGGARGTPTSTIGASLPIVENGGLVVQGMTIGRGAFTDNSGASNTAIGIGALKNVLTTAPTDGIQNVAIGFDAFRALTTGYSSVAIGYQAGKSITTGFQNVLIGNKAGENFVNPSNLICIGQNTGVLNTAGGSEINIGTGAGAKGTSTTTDGFNVHIGDAAGRWDGAQIAKWNTIVGYQSGPMTGATGLNNYIAIGYLAQASAPTNNTVQMGNSSIATARVQVAWTITSDQRFKNNIQPLDVGLDFVNALRPVSYTRTGSDAEEWGLVAQEVEDALPRPAGLLSIDNEGVYGLRKDDLIAALIKSVQELSAEVQLLKAAP